MALSRSGSCSVMLLLELASGSAVSSPARPIDALPLTTRLDQTAQLVPLALSLSIWSRALRALDEGAMSSSSLESGSDGSSSSSLSPLGSSLGGPFGDLGGEVGPFGDLGVGSGSFGGDTGG